ncbi:metalloregulator ArsR/SmtB family transcription factor [Sphingorhabdus sp. EL138]|uniref:ArsR/SmtB family transcription factor n=1 Tax=Sphingorhabdus sp. EL138 TaxID=2073156 RepID=UPI0025EC3C5D|nr:metalloregulator ArsR/SmtB family transcription factor [Sphingorhabdus sp. EL138]
MESNQAIAALSALAQSSRLDAFRLLVQNEPDGLPAGEIARLLVAPQNTVSTHLSILQNANLVVSERQGRSIIYRAQISTLRELMLFLAKDCCGSHETLCAPLVAELACC